MQLWPKGRERDRQTTTWLGAKILKSGSATDFDWARTHTSSGPWAGRVISGSCGSPQAAWPFSHLADVTHSSPRSYRTTLRRLHLRLLASPVPEWTSQGGARADSISSPQFGGWAVCCEVLCSHSRNVLLLVATIYNSILNNWRPNPNYLRLEGGTALVSKPVSQSKNPSLQVQLISVRAASPEN